MGKGGRWEGKEGGERGKGKGEGEAREERGEERGEGRGERKWVLTPHEAMQPWQPGNSGLEEECDGEEVGLCVSRQGWRGSGRSTLVLPEAAIEKL